jgi:hypothetical protein
MYYYVEHLKTMTITWLQPVADFVTQPDESANVSNVASHLVYVGCVWKDDCMNSSVCLNLPSNTAG